VAAKRKLVKYPLRGVFIYKKRALCIKSSGIITYEACGAYIGV